MSFKFPTYSYYKSQHLFARSVSKNRSVPTKAPNVSIRIFRAKHLHLYEGDRRSMLLEIITMRHCGLHNIYYTSQESCKHKSVLFFFFQPPGFWKLYEVCQLPGWTVLRVSLSPGRARRGRRAGVEIRGRDESVPAMPQELHSRVRALFSRPES